MTNESSSGETRTLMGATGARIEIPLEPPPPASGWQASSMAVHADAAQRYGPRFRSFLLYRRRLSMLLAGLFVAQEATFLALRPVRALERYRVLLRWLAAICRLLVAYWRHWIYLA